MQNFTEDVAVTEVITFTKKHNVNRAMPYILQEQGLIQVAAWNSFCDKLDDANKPLREKSHKWAIWLLGLLSIILIILLCIGYFGHSFFDDDTPPRWYTVVIWVLLFLSLGRMGMLKKSTNQTVQKNLIYACDDMSKSDNNLTVSLGGIKESGVDGDSKPENWYINIVIKGMNINNHEIQESFVTEQYLEAYPVVPIDYATATVTATEIPVAYATEVSENIPAPVPVDPLVGSEAPKKYVKTQDGKGLTLNPKYKAWMTANGNPTQ